MEKRMERNVQDEIETEVTQVFVAFVAFMPNF